MHQHARNTRQQVEIRNFHAPAFTSHLTKDVQQGLTASPKSLPCKYFYDARGSEIFEQICRLPEYYPTRMEMGILRRIAPQIMAGMDNLDLIELGSGANWKIRLLLDAVPSLSGIRYIPVDVSASALQNAADELAEIYPELSILGIVADFTQQLDTLPHGRPRLFLFLGSTLGNFPDKECLHFLQNLSATMDPADRLLLGLDMIKQRKTLETAYNDAAGVTAAFNRNILHVLNRELKADFVPHDFKHVAFFNKERERVEMHLEARREMRVKFRDLHLQVRMERGERIRTEICRKFRRERAERMFKEAGLSCRRWDCDERGWFSLVLLENRKS